MDAIKLAATSRAVRLAWIEQSGTNLRCKAKLWIGGRQYQRRNQSTSQRRT